MLADGPAEYPADVRMLALGPADVRMLADGPAEYPEDVRMLAVGPADVSMLAELAVGVTV